MPRNTAASRAPADPPAGRNALPWVGMVQAVGNNSAPRASLLPSQPHLPPSRSWDITALGRAQGVQQEWTEIH